MDKDQNTVEILSLDDGRFVFVENGEVKPPSQLQSTFLIDPKNVQEVLSKKDFLLFNLGRFVIQTQNILYPIALVIVVAGGVFLILLKPYLVKYVEIFVTALINSDLAVTSLETWCRFLGQKTPKELALEAARLSQEKAIERSREVLNTQLLQSTGNLLTAAVGTVIVRKLGTAISSTPITPGVDKSRRGVVKGSTLT